MKKYLSLLIAAIMMVGSLCACHVGACHCEPEERIRRLEEQLALLEKSAH